MPIVILAVVVAFIVKLVKGGRPQHPHTRPHFKNHNVAEPAAAPAEDA